MDGMDMASAMEIMGLLRIAELEEVVGYARHKIALRPCAVYDIEGGAEHAASDCA